MMGATNATSITDQNREICTPYKDGITFLSTEGWEMCFVCIDNEAKRF